RDPRAAVPRQGGDATRLQHPQQDDDPRHLSPDSGRQCRMVGGMDGGGTATAGRERRLSVVLVDRCGRRRPGRLPGVGARPTPALVWFVKLATDPLTDAAAYSPRFRR